VDWWIALWTALLFGSTTILAVVTFFLVLVARNQLLSGRRETKGWQTLKICSNYDSDQNLDRALRSLRTAQDSGVFAGDELKYRMDVYLILNYFDSIAIGIKQNLYVDEIVFDQLHPMFYKYFDEFLTQPMAAKLEIKPEEDYVHLWDLVRSWRSVASRPRTKAP
jgi:hypothetical protein